MRVRLSTFVILVAVELAVLAASLGVVGQLRLARMRVCCVNGLNEQTTP